MSVSTNFGEITDHPLNDTLSSATFNAKYLELENILSDETKDIAIRQQIITATAGENITAGDFVRITATGLFKTDNGSAAGIKNFIGCALESVSTSATCRVATNAVYGLTGLTQGASQYLSTSGAITETRPTAYAKAIGYALSTTSLLINYHSDEVLSASNIFASENVGIGIDSPTEKLHISTSSSVTTLIETTGSGSDATLQLLCNHATPGITQIKFGDSLDGDVGLIKYTHSDNNLSITNNANERMRILGNGSIGIGGGVTTSYNPIKLSIFTGGEDGLMLTGSTTSPVNNATMGCIGFKGLMDGATNMTTSEAMICGVTEENHSGSTAAGALVFKTKPTGVAPGGTPTERLRINSDGDVGINTNDPSAKLHVSAGNIMASEASAANRIRLVPGAVSCLETLDASQSLTFGTLGTERVRILSDGKIGINETAPDVDLEINGDVKIQQGHKLYIGGDVADTDAYFTNTFDKIVTLSGALNSLDQVSAAGLNITSTTGVVAGGSPGITEIGSTNNITGTLSDAALRIGTGLFSREQVITANQTDSYSGGLVMKGKYNGAFTVTNHHFITIENPQLTSTVITNGYTFNFTDTFANHYGLTASDKTANSKDGTITVLVNGVKKHIQLYAD